MDDCFSAPNMFNVYSIGTGMINASLNILGLSSQLCIQYLTLTPGRDAVNFK